MSVSWGNAKEAPKSAGEIVRLKLDQAETTIRLVGELLPRYVYWVTTVEGKKHPVECLQFDRETQTFSAKNKDPIAELPENIRKDIKPQFAYVCNVIHREDNSIKLFDLKKTIFQEITSFASKPDWGNPADPETGYDLTIEKKKTGPQVQNVKYTISPSRSTKPLTAEEKQLPLYELDKLYKRPSYDEVKEWLMKNTVYYVSTGDDEFSPDKETSEDL